MKVWGIALALAAAQLLAGCNSDDTISHGKDMSGAVDMGVDLSGAQVLSGTRLLSGKLTLVSTTSDDYAVVTDGSGLLEAVPLAGGAAIPIDSASTYASVSDTLVFSWSNLSTGGAGKLVMWSAAGGVKSLATSSYPFLAAASSDDSHVLYSDGTSADGTVTDLWVAKADGTGAVKVASQKLDDQPCAPNLSAAGSLFFASVCDGTADAGGTSAEVLAIDPAGGTVKTVASGVENFFNTDSNGTRVLTVDLAGKASVTNLDADGGAPIQLAETVNEAFFLADGATVLYDTPQKSLSRVDVGAATPTVLQATNVSGLSSISYDEKWAIFHNVTDDNAGTSDLYLASAATAGAPVALDDMPTGILYGDPFTDDGSQVLYYTDLDANLDTGTLHARPVQGGADRAITTSAWVSYAATGGKVVYNDNWVSVTIGMTNTGRADLRAIDLAGSAPPVLIATSADQSFALSAARDKVVYTFSETSDQAGLYVAPIP